MSSFSNLKPRTALDPVFRLPYLKVDRLIKTDDGGKRMSREDDKDVKQMKHPTREQLRHTLQRVCVCVCVGVLRNW